MSKNSDMVTVNETPDHAYMGASSSHRWTNCLGSIEFDMLAATSNPEHESSSPFADEGTLAHALAEVSELTGKPLLDFKGHDIKSLNQIIAQVKGEV